MERMTDEEYVAKKGVRCPYCGAHAVRTLSDMDPCDDAAYQDAICDECGKEWIDLFKLVGYSEVNDA